MGNLVLNCCQLFENTDFFSQIVYLHNKIHQEKRKLRATEIITYIIVR